MAIFILPAVGWNIQTSGLVGEWLNALMRNDDHKECMEALEDTLNHFWTKSTLADIFLNSGKWVNQIGNYEECNKSNNTRYILMTLTDLPVVVSLGICAPKKCTVKDFDTTKELLAKTLNDLFKSIMPEDLDVTLKVTNESVIFVDPRANLEDYTKVTPKAIVAIFIIGLLLIMVIVCSLYSSYNPECKETNTTMGKIICSFDFFRNLENLIRIDEKHDQKLRIFDGIRVGAMLWVTFGHSFMVAKLGPVENIDGITDYVKQFSKFHTYTPFFAVDMFFFFSGFLLCFVLMSSRNTKVNILLIIHRIIRLMPTLLFALGLFYCIFPIFGRGPTFHYYVQGTVGQCDSVWWKVLLFIYNYRERVEARCLAWTWYISVDMQLFLISVPFMYILLKKPKIGIYLLLALLAISCTVTMIIANHFDICSSLLKFTDDHSKFYGEAPYARIPPYLVGILAAYFYVLSKTEGTLPNRLLKKLYNAVILRSLCYLMGVGVAISMIYLQYHQINYYKKDRRWIDILNLAFSKSLFVLGMFIFCLPGFAGKGRLLQLISASRPMAVLSRLTYGVYLTHQGFIEFYVYTMHTSMFVSYSELSLVFLFIVTMGYIAAIFCFFVIESPIFSLEDFFLRGRRRKRVEALSDGTKTDISLSSPDFNKIK